MTDRHALIDLLIRHEGERLKAYTDTVGKVTIGCGRNISDVGISREESRYLLDHDIDAVITDLANFPWFAGLDSVRQCAVADFRFNVGPGTFRLFPKFLHAMAIGDYWTAAQELRTSRWDGQVGVRAAEISRMIETGDA